MKSENYVNFDKSMVIILDPLEVIFKPIGFGQIGYKKAKMLKWFDNNGIFRKYAKKELSTIVAKNVITNPSMLPDTKEALSCFLDIEDSLIRNVEVHQLMVQIVMRSGVKDSKVEIIGYSDIDDSNIAKMLMDTYNQCGITKQIDRFEFPTKKSNDVIFREIQYKYPNSNIMIIGIDNRFANIAKKYDFIPVVISNNTNYYLKPVMYSNSLIHFARRLKIAKVRNVYKKISDLNTKHI